MRLRDTWGGVLGLVLAASLAACGGGGGGSQSTPESAMPAAAPGAQKVDPATAGGLKGTVTIDGTAAKNEPIKMNADPYCVQANKTPQFQETYEVGADGK